MLFLYNTTILTSSYSPCTVYARRITDQEARQLIQNNLHFTSAVGHEGTAKILTSILGLPITVNRINAAQKEGDEVLAFKLKTRIPEGSVFSEEELRRLEYEFWLLRYL